VELTPYKFHVSEDIYTSIVLHSDPDRRWRSVFHPRALTKMLSPQDLLTWSIQRFKYAGGTLDIFWNDSPLRRRGLSAWQKLTYGATIYSYLAPLWTVLFLLAPLVYLFTGAAPLRAYTADFYAHLLPFLVVNKLAFMAGTWGVSSYRGEQYYLGFFWLNVKAMRDVLLGRPVKFHVTPKTRQAGNYYRLVWPHLAIIALSAVGLAAATARVLAFGGEPGALAVNAFWTLNNVAALSIVVRSASRAEQG
jgi:cellulose synthase (UDP-forming)